MPASSDRAEAPVEVELLSREAARTLTAARAVLVRLDAAATSRALAADDSMVGFSLGRLSYAADAAGDAVFTVLSTLSIYLDDPLAADEVERFDYTEARNAGSFRP